ncbi:MAG: glutamate--tRNA ligase [Gemmatales bacterium]|nr:glutamate--tRNA ligase [Gemmatales bacterium]
MSVRTRFAPSPTGYLHIGGVRTALFNWLFTRRHGGQFILRIDDTDVERNRPEALRPILDGFRWLGIMWDEGPEVGGPHAPYFQSQRLPLYQEAARKLVLAGQAYPCLATKEELETERRAAELAKRPYIHRGKGRNLSPEEALQLWQEKQLPLRLKVPLGRKIVLDDLIRKRVEWETDLLGDPVILRSDGTPLYNFATVVDDIAMKITHVIRAAEHLSNTPLQILIFEALGASLPAFAHVPVVNEPGSKKKLSKRDMKKFVTPEVRAKLRALGYTDAEIDSRDDLNPATVAYYQELGYLPQALVNYLGRLGWSLDGYSEIIPLETMIAHFSFERVNDAPASFDPDKLYWMAGEYMRQLSVEEKVQGVVPYLVRANLISEPIDPATRDKIRRIVEACGDRLKLFSDILTYGAFFFRDPEYDESAFAKRVAKQGIPELLERFVSVLERTEPFAPENLETVLREFCDRENVKAADLIHAVRVSTTGITVGPGLFDILAILGREESIRRIRLALARVQTPVQTGRN